MNQTTIANIIVNRIVRIHASAYELQYVRLAIHIFMPIHPIPSSIFRTIQIIMHTKKNHAINFTIHML